MPIGLQPVDIGRDIVFTADLQVGVVDVAEASEQALREIQGLGGLLFGQNTVTEPQPQSRLVFKVRPQDFAEASNRLAGIGKLLNQVVSSDDVTERIVDLESRIRTSEVSVERLRALLDSASNLDDIARIEAELLQREQQLEQLRGQLRTLEDQVALATIVVTFIEIPPSSGIDLSTSAYAGHDAGAGCPGDPSLEIVEGTPVTLCFVVTNVGNRPLGDVTITDFALGIDADDELVVVSGDPDQALEPEERLVLAYETTISSVTTQTRVTAVALGPRR